MKEKAERVHFDGDEDLVPRLFRRSYIASGKPRTRYLCQFTDWQHIRRKFALGKNEKQAIQKVIDIDKKNSHEVDFDEIKQKRTARGMTFSKFVEQCPASMKSVSTWHLKPLEKHFGSKLIGSICDADVIGYREKRTMQRIIKHGEESEKVVSQTTINKEIGTLRKFLRFALTKGFVHKVTKFEMHKETSRNRVLSDKEFRELMEKCPTWLRSAVALAWETALSRSDLFKLTWSEIDLREGIIELRNGRGKTGAPQAIPVYTPELKALIAELQTERRRLPNVGDLVLTMDGQPMDKLKFEYHFRKACRESKIKDFVFHDLRHCRISRWATAGVPTAAAMLAAGHSSVASHKKYQNLTKADLKAAFRVLPNCSQEKTESEESAASA